MINFFSHAQTASDEMSLQLESLEERQMLSTVSIFAQGTTGDEAFNVFVDGNEIASISGNSQTNEVIPTDRLAEFQFNLDYDVVADDVRIEFVNDLYDPGNYDRNLRIDRIEIDGRIYRSEDPAVFSTGTWTPEDGVVDGFGRGDFLHSNGYFQYSGNGFGGTNVTTLITFDAQGFGDVVDFELRIKGETVQNYSLSATAGNSFQNIVYRAQGDIRPDDVQIVFTNDRVFTDPISGNQIDRNLRIDNVVIEDLAFDPNNSNVFSTGTWLAQDGVTAGNGRGNFLHSNGYMTFIEGRETTRISVGARALGADNATLAILLDDVVVGTYNVRTSSQFPQLFSFTADGIVSADRFKVAFTNDLYEFDANGQLTDRNLQINAIQIGPDAVYNPSLENVFSTGSWQAEDGITPGYGRGFVLHGNGYFQVQPDRQDV